MQHAVLDLLRAALIPELGADVAAGAAGDVHLVLIGVAALGAFPDELAVFLNDLDLAVPAADLAVVALGVQLGVDDVVVDELHDLQHGVEVLLHVRDLDIADRAAGREVLELRLELELGERVDLFRHVDVVGVRDVVAVRDAGDDPEALLEANQEKLAEEFARADDWIMHIVSNNCPCAGMYDQKYKELVQDKAWSAVRFPGCKGCIYAAEDIRCDERVVQSGFELQRCQKYPGTDKEGFADFKPANYFDGTEECQYKHSEWKRE